MGLIGPIPTGAEIISRAGIAYVSSDQAITDAPVHLAQLSDALELVVGFAEILRIEGNVSTIVLGDPSIADASPLDPMSILLTGQAAGTTNMIVLDESGQVLADLMLHVGSRQPGTVTVRRALDAQTYICNAGLCEGSLEGVTGGSAPAVPPASAEGGS